MNRLGRAIRHDGWQIVRLAWRAGDVASVIRFATDLFRLRCAKALRRKPSGRERTIRLRGGVRLTYRLNAGDTQSIREVWLDECYRLPFKPGEGVLIDLGSNIGSTSVWLAGRYGFRRVIAVEPSPENARLTRANLTSNQIEGEVIEAAVGPEDGVVCFQDADASNVGRVASEGRQVRMISMATLLEGLSGEEPVAVVKLDIEGGEEPLIEGDLAWLGRIPAIIAELHPSIIDHHRVIAAFEKEGFLFIPPGSVFEHSTDTFVKEGIERIAPIGTGS